MSDKMEWSEILGISLSILFAILLFGSLLTGIIHQLTEADAAENAQKICESKGYDTYQDYSRKLFGTKAYGVRCNYIQNRRELITNTDTVVAVTN